MSESTVNTEVFDCPGESESEDIDSVADNAVGTVAALLKVEVAHVEESLFLTVSV